MVTSAVIRLMKKSIITLVSRSNSINERIGEISVMKHSLFNQQYASQEKFVDQTKVFRASRWSTVWQSSRASPALPRPATVNKLHSNGIPPLFAAAAAARRSAVGARAGATLNFPVPITGAENLLENFRDQVI